VFLIVTQIFLSACPQRLRLQVLDIFKRIYFSNVSTMVWTAHIVSEDCRLQVSIWHHIITTYSLRRLPQPSVPAFKQALSTLHWPSQATLLIGSFCFIYFWYYWTKRFLLTVIGELCGRFLQSTRATGATDDLRLFTDQNLSDDKMADDRTVLVQRRYSITKLTQCFLKC